MELTLTLDSLIESSAIWVCASMMPGMTCLPEASMTRAPAGVITFSPTSAILPSRMTMEPLKVPLVTVCTVAFWMTRTSAAQTAPARKASASILVGIAYCSSPSSELGPRPGAPAGACGISGSGR